MSKVQTRSKITEQIHELDEKALISLVTGLSYNWFRSEGDDTSGSTPIKPLGFACLELKT